MNPSPASQSPEGVSRQVRVEKVWSMLRDLARSLFAKGLSAKAIHGIYARSIHVNCEACGSELKDTDLVALLDAASDSQFPNPKLERLHKGYCLKSGCDSYFYRVRFMPVEGIDWKTALPEAEALPAKLAAEEKQREPFSWNRFVHSPNFRVSAGVVVLLLLLAYRHWYFNGSLPFASKRFETANPHPEFSREAPRAIPTAGSIRAATLDVIGPDDRSTNTGRIKVAPRP